MTNTDQRRAPDHAWIGADLAGLNSHARISRLDRPKGTVSVEATAGLTIVVRINLLAREVGMGLSGPTRLKQCLAPDYYVLSTRNQRIALVAHDAQAIIRLHIDSCHVRKVIGDEATLYRLTDKIIADGFVTGIVERLMVDDVGGSAAKLNYSLIETLLLTLRSSATSIGSRPASGGLTARQLATLREHVESRLSRPLRNTELAELVGLSQFHFARAFKQSMGASPAAWIRLRRLTVAQRLLADHSLSITEVAAAVGYESPSRFARAFRNTTGHSPTAFRRSVGR